MKTPFTFSTKVYWAFAVLLFFVPLYTSLAEQAFYLDLMTRVLILAIAAVSLNLILGYGGMISLGHAAFIGIGAYCVGIPSYYDVYNGYIHLGLSVFFSALFALITGMICLRTKGVYFIMITLAFAQMLYFTFVSLDEYGADDGLLIYQRSELGIVDIENPVSLYYTVLVVLLGFVWLSHKIIHARFGRVIIGSRHNDERMQALGYNPYHYKLACYVISGTMAGVGGFFLGNFTNYISPEMMDWTHSGELIFMIVLGGTGILFAPVVGTTVFLLLEEFLSEITVDWHLIFGLMLIALVLFGKGGLHGLLERFAKKRNQS